LGHNVSLKIHAENALLAQILMWDLETVAGLNPVKVKLRVTDRSL